MQQIDPQPRQTRAAHGQTCRRCRRTHLAQAAAGASLNVCLGCRAQEVVARHIPPAQRWSAGR